MTETVGSTERRQGEAELFQREQNLHQIKRGHGRGGGRDERGDEPRAKTSQISEKHERVTPWRQWQLWERGNSCVETRKAQSGSCPGLSYMEGICNWHSSWKRYKIWPLE